MHGGEGVILTIPIIKNNLFSNKQNIPWDNVEKYLKKYIGHVYVVNEYQDRIYVAGDFPNEYAESQYTKKLRGALAKVKANAAQIIDTRLNQYKATLVVRRTSRGLFLMMLST